ncbi:MAG: TolC family protein [Polyangiales bacterium]
MCQSYLARFVALIAATHLAAPLARAQAPAPAAPPAPSGSAAQAALPVPVAQPASSWPQPAPASTGAVRLTFKEALQRARVQPPSVLFALATLARSRAEASYARGAYIPGVTLEGGTGVTYDNRSALPNNLPPEQRIGAASRIDSTAQNSFGRVNVELAVLDFARRNNIAAADASIAAELGNRDTAVRDALAATSRIYVRGVAAIELVSDAELTLARRTAQHAAIQGLVKAGLRPSVDAARAEIEMVAARHQVRMREVEREASFAALSAAIGGDPTRPAQPVQFDDASLPLPASPAEAAALAMDASPQLRAGRATRDARRFQDKSARAARYPTLGVNGSANANYADIWSGTGIEGSSYYANGGAYLRWAALDATVWRRAVVTGASLTEAERQLDAVTLQIRAQVVEASFEVSRADALLAQATEVLRAAQVARTAQNERYKAGVASLLELLDAETVEQNARRQRIEATRDHRSARTELLSTCGVIEQLAR